MEIEKQGFLIDARRPAAVVSMLAFALSVPMQILGYADRLHDPFIAGTLVFLPVLSALGMIVSILCFGREKLRLSIVPVFIGVLGFAFKLVIDPRGESLLHHISAALLYAAIVVLWALTVYYVIRTKWVLVILFLLPLCKHILVNDLPVLLGTAAQVPASTWLKECSILSFLLALTFCALAFEKREQ